ncbi:MAG: hypothetical protein AAGK37_21705, partial [Pseudomonadota bacterium]
VPPPRGASHRQNVGGAGARAPPDARSELGRYRLFDNRLNNNDFFFLLGAGCGKGDEAKNHNHLDALRHL